VKGYDLSTYSGIVHQDGVGVITDTIMGSPEPITLVCIGPVPNIAAALDREPRIAERARFVGMHGCLRKSPPKYADGGGGVVPEYNVLAHPKACQKAFTAPWDMTITPLDTCGFVTLKGDKYRVVRECDDPLVQALMENYRVWLQSSRGKWEEEFESKSSSLFDTVAVYLAFSEELLSMEELGVRVTDDGYTVIDEDARTVKCATEWKDLPAFESLLVERLTDIRI